MKIIKNIKEGIQNLKKMDYWLLIAVIVMTVFGIVMIFSASSASTVLKYFVSSSNFFFKQCIWLLLGLIGGICAFFASKDFCRFAGVAGIIGITVLLIVVLVSGSVVGNASSWLTVMGAKFQPTEFSKTLLILFMATYYEILEKYDNRLMKHKKGTWHFLYYIPIGIGLVLTYIILKQPDMGTAIIFFGICCLTFVCVPSVSKYAKKLLVPVLLIGGAALLTILVVGLDNILTPEQYSRLTFKDPCQRYSEDTGYQVCNGLIAISNGGLLGTGLGNSTQKYLYLPESHTDFIFPIICEECGSLTGFVIILVYAFILLRIHKIARNSDNTFGKLIAYGTMWFLSLHIIINLLGILSLIPITGVPLPFLSYGGSFLFNAYLLIFLTERVNAENKKSKLKREIASMSKYKGR